MNKLEHFRKSKGMTMVDFCIWLDISPNTYRRLINGNLLNMYVETFIKVKKKTGYSVEDLFPDTELCKIIKQ